MSRLVSASGFFDIKSLRRKLRGGVRTTTRTTPTRFLPRLKRSHLALAVIVFLLAVLGVLAAYEMRTSRLQSRIISRVAADLSFSMEPGPSPSIRFPEDGPYDKRLGYVDLPSFTQRLTSRGYMIEAQARFSPKLLRSTELGLFTTYHEKTQAGLRILDREGREVFSDAYPGRLYSSFVEIPDAIVNGLLFIENRELLDEESPYRNPAVEWDRFAQAVFHLGVQKINKEHDAPGGSTLATQMEKYMHSPGGRTSSGVEKLRQMASASLRAYLDGEETLETRRQIILEYINSIPLGAVPGYGEVIGIGDGLWAWYGVELDQANQRLASAPTSANDPNLHNWALAYKQVLSLLLAQRKPTYYLIEAPDALEERTNSYVRTLAKGGVLLPFERDAVLRTQLEVRGNKLIYQPASFTERKAANAIRPRLLSLLGISQLYELDRLDLTVRSTLDNRTQEEVTRILRQLRDPVHAEAAGLRGYRILERGDPAGVIYSFTLYERGNNANLLRVQTDNFNQPLNINEGVKLELGSTAKLRTLITYLDIITTLHGRYAGLTPGKLRAISVPETDRLSRWAIGYLSTAGDKRLRPMLDAAMERYYSASPSERFFTGGGQHTFHNFDSSDNGKVMSVRQAFYDSVNLVFIRLMRDCVRYYMYQRPGIVELFENPEDPRREEYLIRFADKEGQVYQRRFYRKYYGKSPEEALELLAQSVSYPLPARFATIFRSVAPEGSFEEFSAFMRSYLPNWSLPEGELLELYEKYAITAFSLHDRGYIARIHPLELWTVAYLRTHPQASFKEVIEASASERREVYGWLFKTGRKHRQDLRIQMLVEAEAFEDILQVWKRLGYPFDYLVPSYATSIGVSGDRPAALAELVGILLNNGMRYPSVRIEALHFAEGAPYETIFQRERDIGQRVLHPEIAAVIKDAMMGVVEQGTAKRLHKTFTRENDAVIPVGGKTGTGDNRRDIYGARGRLISSQVVSRTATFVFFIGDRFFGVLTAYVPGPDAANYRFTSALPVQVLKHLAPALMPLVGGTKQETVSSPEFSSHWERLSPALMRARTLEEIPEPQRSEVAEAQAAEQTSTSP